MNNIKSRILSQFKSIIHPDNFRHNLRIKGGSIPPDEIITLLENLEKENFTLIKDFIPKIFNEFLHNRVGTLLTKSEVELTNTFFKPKFTPGTMLVYKQRNDEYIWVILKNKINQNNSNIIIKQKNIYSEKSVQNKKLFCYPSNEKIIFDSVKNMKFDESYIYETYNFDAI